MNHEIVSKIDGIVAADFTEASVQHLFALARKLVERVPETDRPNYALLKFYGDWTLHSKIDRSKEGAIIIQRIHDTIIANLQTTSATLASDLTTILSLDQARVQLNDLIQNFGGAQDTFDSEKWKEIIPILMEIISHNELEIGGHPKLTKILQAIQAKPLKGTSVVTKLSIVKIPTLTFSEGVPPEMMTFCMLINTTDTTKFIVPIIK